jgi:hypothetical protein
MKCFVILFAFAAAIATPTLAQAKGGTFHLFSAQAAQAADAAKAAAHANAPTSVRTVEHTNWRRARALAHFHDVRTVGSI